MISVISPRPAAKIPAMIATKAPPNVPMLTSPPTPKLSDSMPVQVTSCEPGRSVVKVNTACH